MADWGRKEGNQSTGGLRTASILDPNAVDAQRSCLRPRAVCFCLYEVGKLVV